MYSSGVFSQTVPKIEDKKIKVCLIGAGGYVGSRLHDYLYERFDIHGIDRDLRLSDRNKKIHRLHSRSISTEFISTFDFVIYLGGCTGRVACSTSELAYEENVSDIINLVSKMVRTQILIFASTSAVTEGCGKIPRSEDDVLSRKGHDIYSNSMILRENELKQFVEKNIKSPKMIGLRFGTVIGLSPGQRTDLLLPSLFKSAYSIGILEVKNPTTYRAFLWIEDLVQSIEQILVHADRVHERFSLFHLQSFAKSIGGIASAVARVTGANIKNVKGLEEPAGFSLSTSKFEKTFHFRFSGIIDNITQEMDHRVPDSITPKGPHIERNIVVGKNESSESIPCPVCGSHHLQEVLDFHSQPLANGFLTSPDLSLNMTRYPLKLMRCKICNHMHLSKITDRQTLFSDYLYQSGTSKTLLKYFEWLAKKVDRDVLDSAKNVIEIACNDGSQLDEFKKLGWTTYGVDPAANIVPIAVKKGHNVKVGFWGKDSYNDFPKPNSLGAIVAQNVFAHVGDPISFLKSCEKVMGAETKLYIQTSQCQMFQEGQFDTAYHEHISFFSGHSFLKAAELSNLHITNFELTPIHGTSCLVTFEKETKSQSFSPTLQKRLDYEVSIGMTKDFFYFRYREKAFKVRIWITKHLRDLYRSGYILGAYGAAAKGMVLLHFILESSNSDFELSFVVDDAPLKQNRFCPGTKIPVWQTSKLSGLKRGSKVTLFILAWNFWDEILMNIKGKMAGVIDEILCIIPFPHPRLVRVTFGLNSTQVDELSSMPYSPTEVPNVLSLSSRRNVVLISHFFNEEFLLPYWIRHHASMFDSAILIDYGSTDKSIEIINEMAPATWRVVSSSTGTSFFPGNDGNDGDVKSYESQHVNEWKIALTITEFLVYPRFRESLAFLDNRIGVKKIIQIPATAIVGNESFPLNPYASLVEQRSAYSLLDKTISKRSKAFPDTSRDHRMKGVHLTYNPSIYSRFLHFGFRAEEYNYGAGRHDITNIKGVPIEISTIGFIMKYLFSPWPESIKRKVQIKSHLREEDGASGWQHRVSSTHDRVNQLRESTLEGQDIFDFKSFRENVSSDRWAKHKLYHQAIDPEFSFF